MTNAEKPKYQSPSKKIIEDALAKAGPALSPELRTKIEAAIASIDHTDPQEFIRLLPPSVIDFYRFAVLRAMELAPLIKAAFDSGCFIESIILSHGLIQFALRGLYVLAWQRAKLPTPLSADELAPYYKQGSRQGDVFHLIGTLGKHGLIDDSHANHLRNVNTLRNRAAHGVIFGEMSHSDLGPGAEKAQYAALGALERLQAWFNNPQPLQAPTGAA
jgi:hypothetical protein